LAPVAVQLCRQQVCIGVAWIEHHRASSGIERPGPVTVAV
jgi:hypothetical protein